MNIVPTLADEFFAAWGAVPEASAHQNQG